MMKSPGPALLGTHRTPLVLPGGQGSRIRVQALPSRRRIILSSYGRAFNSADDLDFCQMRFTGVGSDIGRRVIRSFQNEPQQSLTFRYVAHSQVLYF